MEDKRALQGQCRALKNELAKQIDICDVVLAGIGEEWSRTKSSDIKTAYESLYQMIGDKDYFVVTAVTDGVIYETGFSGDKIVAPCGNDGWFQCEQACTADIWEKKEIEDGLCPRCKSPLVPNTIRAKHYIEDGYLRQWKVYMDWLARTLNRKLLLLELGVGFETPTVIRWPFEKTVFFNERAHMYRINEKFSQISEGRQDKVTAVTANSVEFIREM